MTIRTTWLAIAALCFTAQLSFATDADSQRHCLVSSTGQTLCSPNPHGSVYADDMGDVLCGVGRCGYDDLGDLQCAKTPGGRIKYDELGVLMCQGGCEPASESLCQAPTAEEKFDY